MTRSHKSFSDLQRELISAQIERRRVAQQSADALDGRIRADDQASMRQPFKLSVVES